MRASISVFFILNLDTPQKPTHNIASQHRTATPTPVLPCLAEKRVADHFIDRDAKSNAPDAIRPENYYKSCWADKKYLKALLVEHGSYFPKTHQLPAWRTCSNRPNLRLTR